MQVRKKIKEVKKCNKCGEIKQQTEFYKNNTRSCGLDNLCKDCRKTMNVSYIPKKDYKAIARAKKIEKAKTWEDFECQKLD